MRKIKVNDKVLILKGKDKGKQGVVSKFVLKSNNIFVFVEGLNLVKKNVKSNPNKNQTHGIITKEAPINYSNICIINSKTNKRDKIGFKFLENGKKVRFYKSSGEVLE